MTESAASIGSTTINFTTAANFNTASSKHHHITTSVREETRTKFERSEETKTVKTTSSSSSATPSTTKKCSRAPDVPPIHSNPEEILRDPELERRRMEHNERMEKRLTDDIVRGLESIEALTSQHLQAKGLNKKDRGEDKSPSSPLPPPLPPKDRSDYGRKEDLTLRVEDEEEDKVVYEEVDVQEAVAKKEASEQQQEQQQQQQQTWIGQVRKVETTTTTEKKVEEKEVETKLEEYEKKSASEPPSPPPQKKETEVIAVEIKTTEEVDSAPPADIKEKEEEEKEKSKTPTEETEGANVDDGTLSYTELGETFKGLTERMRDVMSDMRANEEGLPFIDDDDVGEEERRRGGFTEELDRAILEATGLDQEQTVQSIQLPQEGGESSPVVSVSPAQGGSVVVEERRGEVEIKREFADV